MPTAILANRVRVSTATSGTGTATLGAAYSAAFCTFAEAGILDAQVVRYEFEEGNDFEIGLGTYTASGTTLSRDTVTISKIAGTAGTSKMTLAGAAVVRIVCANEDIVARLLAASNLSDAADATTAIANVFPVAKRQQAAANVGLVASVATSALTIALKGADGADPSATNPVHIPFRNATAATGTPTWQSVTAALSLVISSGSTMGFTSATAGRLWIVAFDDAGTIRLGAINVLNATSVYPLRDSILVSSTAEGGAGAADSAQVFYTGTAVTTKALRILGYMEWSAGLTTAGTWDIVPTTIQVSGLGVLRPNDFTLADASEMEAGTAIDRAVVPAYQHRHPGHLKAWVHFNGDGTVGIQRAFKVSSITDNGTGDYTVNFTTNFSAADYAMIGTCGQSAAGGPSGVVAHRQDTPVYSVSQNAIYTLRSTDAVLLDYPKVSVAYWGDQ